ncbi:1,6-anhydro-N-acetylmuramyl-L-alanine amidase AmpD [Moraxella nasovis]|uniref:1,6-anhydro-N-acetylmuramyl-L-alanine amidase AmpD n=1 Tax=Moraxella nasovis TaxID=2904121 RepID=UPI001F60539D|nr:1,6-anhydro-N-acetylmuramyl-L-alanine amidase AmpD [Moraxella nasovis]UNU74282.1 1,6-anhydro-N-acetylmuramyl-L-alanine amidase AmpD [Moraxella nasovis]
MMTRFTIANGVLTQAAFIASPNFNLRPALPNSIGICGIVIHNISLPPNQFGKTNKDGTHFVKAFFQNKLDKNDHPYFKEIHAMQVSAHLFIERDGVITQFVNFNDRAWHAGHSRYLGRDNCNDFTIGIELEGSDNTAFTDVQYDVLTDVILAIYHAYPDTLHHLMGHSDIAPVRKTDPGVHFDWVKLRQMLHDRQPQSEH